MGARADRRAYTGLRITPSTCASRILSDTTNLAGPVNWLPLATNTTPGSDWFILDLDSPFSSQRFYRLKP